MAETSDTSKADHGLVHKRGTTVPKDSDYGITGRSDGKGKSVLNWDESIEPEPHLLHTKLLAIAEAVQQTNTATLAEFETLLLRKASEIDVQDTNGKTALHIAIEHGLKNEARCLVDAGANVAIDDREGQQPLYLACLEGSTELVELLLRKGAFINAALKNGETPLAAACRQGHTAIIDILLDEKADTQTLDDEGWTPLHLASWENLEKAVDRLLKLDTSNIDAIEHNFNWTPLNTAVYRGHEKIVSLLLENKADLYIKDNSNWTPLMAATSLGYPEVVSRILSHTTGWKKGYLEIGDNEKHTPLHVASMKGYSKIASQLIAHGANCNAKAKDGMTPLHFASGAIAKDTGLSETPDLISDNEQDCREGESKDSSDTYFHIVELLLQHQADPSIEDDNHKTALHRASTIGDKARINALLNSTKSEDLSWKHWNDSPVYSALGGFNPQIAMESLFAKQEFRKAPFLTNEGQFQVIKEVLKIPKPETILSLIFGEEPREGWQIPREGFRELGLVQWAADKRLPDILSNEIGTSEPCEELDEMVHQALRTTCKLFRREELTSKESCEKLLQVMAVLITNSARTTVNEDSVNKASKSVAKYISFSEEKAGKMVKKPDLERDQLSRVARLGESSSAVPNRIRNPEGRGIEGLQIHVSRTDKRYDVLSRLRDILKDPPFEQVSRTYKDEVVYKLPRPGPNYHKIVEKSEATVVAFYKGKSDSGRIRRNRGLKEIVYSPGPTKVVERCINDLNGLAEKVSMPFSNDIYSEKNLKLTWVHLPSTNLVWMNDLLTTIMYNENYPNRDYSEVRSFFRDSWVEVPDGTSSSRMMRPQFVLRLPKTTTNIDPKNNATSKLHKEDEKEIEEASRKKLGAGEENENSPRKAGIPIADSKEGEPEYHGDPGSHSLQDKLVQASATYMPYLVYSTHCRDWKQGRSTESHELQKSYADYDYLMQSYEGQQQHGSPTLDEWYYQFAQDDQEATDDQEKRNESQVVSKYLKETEDASSNFRRNQWTVVRVNQLWIWTIAKKWVITATSSPFDNRPDALVDEILNLLSRQADSGGGRAQPVSADQLVPVIIDYCVGSYERSPKDNKISIGQTFSRYINSIGRKETTLFDDFRKWSPDEGRRKKKKSKPSPAEQLLHFVQERIAESYPERARANYAESKQTAHPPHIEHPYIERISAAIQRAKTLCFHIKDVRDEISILKSVAQHQQIVQRGIESMEVDESRLSSTYVVKNLEELDDIAERIQSAVNTTLSLQQSEIANRQATEATKQGNTVMTFTFATVLFLPLSFLSSLFALDVASFQQAPAWAFYVIFFASAGISLILGYGVFYWNNIFDVIEKAFEGDSKPNSNRLNLPEEEHGRNDDIGRDDNPASIAPESEAGEPRFRRLFRRHGRRANEEDIEIRAAK
ncbi:hypothetical protein FGADI_13572 [Fusarium gaditjirri]|uniref:Ankyrin repeat protein n=1 Tax=Fusarium gaditjirri TaxID=282569 RepID=A0A8H4WM19_9HYPO|nr:hypothetical protein FGADI_13572 [Fusarium gaditjirri]